MTLSPDAHDDTVTAVSCLAIEVTELMEIACQFVSQELRVFILYGRVDPGGLEGLEIRCSDEGIDVDQLYRIGDTHDIRRRDAAGEVLANFQRFDPEDHLAVQALINGILCPDAGE